MKKILLRVLLLGILFTSSQVFAQKKQYTIAEATNGMTTTLALKSVKSPCWQPGTDCLWQIEKKDGKDVYKVIDFSTKAHDGFFVDASEFFGKSKMTNLPAIKWLDKEKMYAVNG